MLSTPEGALVLALVSVVFVLVTALIISYVWPGQEDEEE